MGVKYYMIYSWVLLCGLWGGVDAQPTEPKTVVELLRELATTTQVEVNGELNRSRVDSLRAEIARAPSWSRAVRLRLQLGDQLLRAGQTREAIKEFGGLQAELTRRQSPAPLRGTWPVHSLLGLAYLRLGEQENCLHHHHAESCRLPISAGRGGSY